MTTGLLWLLCAVASAQVLDGDWVLDEPWEQVQARHAAAVERGVAQLHWAFRPVARPILARSIWSCGGLQIGLQAELFTATCDDKDPLKLPRTAGRTASEGALTGSDGQEYSVKLELEPSVATVSFSGARGGQVDRYEAVGGTLVVTRRLVSAQLTEPVEWTVRYRPR